MGLTRAGSSPAPGMFKKLKEKAKKASENAYAPYSKFKVGAAILGLSGKIYTGSNIENSSYGLTVCAERVALFKGVSEGEKKFIALAVYTEKIAYPCGACLQVLSEFADKDMKILLFSSKEEKIFSLLELYPNPFKLKRIKRR